MLMCSKCKKRPAVVFISQMGNNDKSGGVGRGLCITCAMEEGIPQVEEYMKRMGLTEDDIRELSEAQIDIDEGDSFEHGGSSTLPEIFGNLMGSVEKLFNQTMPPAEPLQNGGDMPDANARRMPRPNRREKPNAMPKLKYLNAYCTDLSQKAADGTLDNIIGREREISRVIQILSRRQKNNPCLIGEPGVGKTAIAEGIAQKIQSGEVPYRLANKKVYLLDMAALVAGTQFRGQFESRCKGLIDEVKRLGNVILFIDEIHSIVGAGDSEGSMSASNILKPALSRGEVQVIGATTFKEYRKYIEKDAALERRFQPVTVNEPNIADTIKMLDGIKKYYEAHHHITVPDETVRLCATLSERYITDRYLPDKAIDLLDEACAYASTRSRELERLQWLENDRKAAKEELEAVESQPEQQQNEPDYEHIAELKMKCLKLDSEYEELKPIADAAVVTEEDLAHVIEIWTGIPASKIEREEYEKIRDLPETLSKRVIGQPEAVKSVCAAIRRSRAHLSKRVRPASFIFVGPTGVGKTELVKALGEALFDDTEPIIRVDMSEYMERHSVSKLIGSPPGYVGFDEAGQLTEKVRRRPYSVVLFDEIEKAHPDVMNIMLQILDEGEIHDAQGRLVSFKNTVIVMTSNAGSTDKDTGVGFNKTEKEISKEKALKALREFLRPEFLGRIDEIVVFDPLTKENYKAIAALMLDEIKEPLGERGISMTYKDSALEAIAEKSYGQKLGGRDIRRVIREQVEDRIADIFVERGETSIRIICVYAENGEIGIMAE